MLIPKELIEAGKDKMGEDAAFKIIEDLKVENFDAKNLKASCPFHKNDNTPSFIWNSKGNYWKCFGCGKHTDIISHYMEFNKMTFIEACEKLFEQTNINFKFSEKDVKTKREYKYPTREENIYRDNVEEYISKRKISAKTLNYCDVQQDKNNNIVFHYYDTNDVLMLVKYRPARKLKDGEIKTWCQKDADTTPLLFNMNKIDPSKPLVITEGECFPGHVEILTKEGWVRLDQYENQEVMQVDENMNGSFVRPNAYIKKFYNDELYEIRKGGNYTSLTTKNHNLVYIDNKKKLIKRPASTMPKYLNNAYIPMSLNYSGTGVNLTKDQIALYLAISADGTIDIRPSGSRYTRFSLKKDRKYIRLRNILEKLGIDFFCNPNIKGGYKYIGFQTPTWIKSKILPQEWIYSLSLEQKNFILKEIMNWDGNIEERCNRGTFTSTILQNAELIQILARTSGKMSSITKGKNKKGHNWYQVRVYYKKKDISLQKIKIKKTNFNGEVFCVNVDSGMILVRQNGHISVSGNCDTLAVIESGWTNVVSVPFGANNYSWIEENYSWLEQFDKIIVFADGDSAGIKMRTEVTTRLGEWRCYYVEIPEELRKIEYNGKQIEIKDANEVLFYHGKDKVISLIENANEIPISNVRDLADIRPLDLEKVEGIKSGLKQLDKWINKFFFGTLVITTGTSGSGKSVWLNQVYIAEALNQGYDAFLMTGELSLEQEQYWLNLALAGKTNIEVKNNHFKHISLEKLKTIQNWYKGRVFIYDNEIDCTSKSILKTMEELVRKKGVKVFVLDNLMTIDLECNHSDIWMKQKEFVVKLVNFARKYNVLVHLIAHPRKLETTRRLTKFDVSGSGDITNLAHYVLSIHRVTPKEAEGTKDHRGGYKVAPNKYSCMIDLFKNRLTGIQDKEMGVHFDVDSYRFYTTNEELYKQYAWDKSEPFDFNNLNEPNDNDLPQSFKDR